MNSSQSQNIALVIIVFFGFNVHIVTSKHSRSSKVPVHMSSDFMNFLHNLGSRVFTLKARKRLGAENDYEATTKISEVYSTRNMETWKSETNFGVQKDALRDALMMKLVSYYEDKYKLSDSHTTTTTPAPKRRNIRITVDRSSKTKTTPSKRHFTRTRQARYYKATLVPDVEVI